MADVLVTGATGLLGSGVVRMLAPDHTVWAVTRSAIDQTAGVKWLKHDLSGQGLPADLPSRIDVVIHLAQGTDFRNFPGRARNTFAVNVGSTALLLDYAVRAGARRFLLASTGGVYKAASGARSEDDSLDVDGPSFYAATKIAGEVLARAYRSQLQVCVLRPFFIYGRGQRTDMLIPRLVASLRAGQPITIDGRDGMRFNPIHVSDAARAVAAALDLDESSVVNVAGPEVFTLRHAVGVLSAQLDVTAQVVSRPAAAADFVGDVSRMTALLGAPAVTLADAAPELCG